MTTSQKKIQLSVDFFDRPEICAVTVEHGIKGQAATIMLLCAIYQNGYFIEWKPENYISILKELPGIKINKLPKIVKTLVEWGFFDKEAFEKYQVLTSREIQQQYLASQEGNLSDADDLPYWMTIDNEIDNNEVLEGKGSNTDERGEENENLDDNEVYNNKGLNKNKQFVANTQVFIGTTSVSFPARTKDCIKIIKENQPRMKEISSRHHINPEELNEWLRLFADENEQLGKMSYHSYDELMNCFDHWMATGKIRI